MSDDSGIEWGFVSNCLGQTTLDEAVSVAREIGLTCIEVGPSVKRDLPAFKRIVTDGAVRLASFIYARNVLTPDSALRAEYLRETRRLLDLAILLGVPQITMAVGARQDWTFEDNLRGSLEFWVPLFEEGAGAGVRFALEFCPAAGNFALGPAAWRQMFAQCRDIPNFGLNFDPSHLLWQMIDPYTPLLEFSDRIFSVHAKDSHVKREVLAEHGITTPYRYQEIAPQGIVENRAPWWEFRIPGEGDLNWPRFLGGLRDVGYRGTVMIELEANTYLGSRERVLDGLRRSLTHLRAAGSAAPADEPPPDG